VAKLGGSIQDLVPEMVERRLREKLDPAVKLQNARVQKSEKRGKAERKKRTGKSV
jgi:hypothetical protein